MTIPLPNSQFMKFIAVGVTNTLVDFTVFFTLVSIFGVYFVLAAVFSTTAALITSYILNSRYTFDKVVGAKGIVTFMVITLAGIWVLQPCIIFMSEHLLSLVLRDIPYEYILLASKAFASATSFGWNYVLYKKTVFST